MSASATAATSWTRKTRAPRSSAITHVATVPCTRPVTSRPVSVPMNDLREVPITSGRPRSVSSSSRASSSRLCSSVLPKPIPGSSWIRSSAHAGVDREAHPLLEERLDVGHHVVVARIVLHRPRLAEHVHQAAVEPAVGDEAGHVGVVAERADVVDVAWRRRATAASATASFIVSIETRVASAQPLDDRDRPARSSSSTGTGSAPGRVDSPPTSMIVGALGDQPPAVRDGLGGVVELPAVREGVGRDVDHAHDLESHPLNATGRPEGGGLGAAGGGFRGLPGGGGDAGSGEGGGELPDDGDRVGVGSQGAVGSGSDEGHGEREGVGVLLDT